jgi:hypothetical protein
MSSAAQVSANRANAQLSTGPQTEAGLAAIAHNNFRHGLASAFVVLPTEDHTAYDDLLLNLNLEFSPSTETEEILVTAMAQHHWLEQRALRLQQPLFEAALETGSAPDAKQLGLYLRYQSTNDRAYHKALSQLLRLRSDRRCSQMIGFESQKARNQMQEAQIQARLAAFAEAQTTKQAQAVRAQEMKEEIHAAKLRQTEARASFAEFEDYAKRTMEAPLPGEGRVDIEQIYKVMMAAIRVANAENYAKKQKEAA